jgi:hypothetical protein
MGMIGAFLLFTALAVATLAPGLTPYEPAETIRDADGRALTFAPPSMQWAAKMFPRVESSHPGTTTGRFFSQAARSQLSLGSIWKYCSSVPWDRSW